MKHRHGIIATVAALMLLPMLLQAADAPAAPKAEDRPTTAKPGPDKPGKDKAAVNCEATDGSRIRKSKAECAASQDPGKRVISADELNNTGEMNTGDALRKLDPRVQ